MTATVTNDLDNSLLDSSLDVLSSDAILGVPERVEPDRNSSGAPLPSFHLTDLGNARLFSFLHGRRLRFDHAKQKWLVWQGHWWAEDRDGTVRRMAQDVAKYRWRTVRDKSDLGWARSSESRAKLEAAIKLAEVERPFSDPGDNWDSDPLLLGVSNGVVDLRTGKLRQGKQTDRITLHADTAFDSAARCPRWELFLDDIFCGNQELIQFIQRAVGYTLTGLTTEQVFLACYGTGANGKSTFLEVLRQILGQYACNLPFSAFELNSRSAIPNDLATLPGRRFVTALETGESVQLNEARIKMLTGCDPISARLLYREYFTFTPVGKFWLAFNHKPVVADDSHGFWRRVLLIPFEKQFDKDKADPKLLEKLKAEAPGMLAWAVRGCLQWQAEGLGRPAAIDRATAQYREESDPIQDFLSEECLIGAELSVPTSELRKAYHRWAEVCGEKALVWKQFSDKLKACGFSSKPVGHGKVWTWFGLALREGLPAFAEVRADAGAKSPLLVN